MKTTPLHTTCILIAWSSLPLYLVAAAHTRCAAQSESADSARAAARQFGEQGIEAFRADDFARADEKLEQAYRLYPTPTLGLWSARARLQLGRLVEASERLREATGVPETVGDAAAQKAAQADAAKELDTLLPRIPTITVRLEAAQPAEVRITLDGGALQNSWVGVARPTDPGSHRLTATRGSERYETEVRLAEREQKVVLFRFKAATAPAKPAAAAAPVQPVAAAVSPAQPSTAQAARAEVDAIGTAGVRSAEAPPNVLKPLGITALAFGGVSFVVSGVAFMAANRKLDDCPDRICEFENDKTSYDRAKTLSTVAFYLGAAFSLVGGVTLVTAATATEPTPPAVSWRVGPSGVAVNGAF